MHVLGRIFKINYLSVYLRKLEKSEQLNTKCSVAHVQILVTPWTVAYQAPPSMEFSRQEYWSGLPFPSPGDLPNPGIEPRSPALQAEALPSEPPGKPQWSFRTWYNVRFGNEV